MPNETVPIMPNAPLLYALHNLRVAIHVYANSLEGRTQLNLRLADVLDAIERLTRIEAPEEPQP